MQQSQGLTQLLDNNPLSVPPAPCNAPPSRVTPMPDFDFFSTSTNATFAHFNESGESLKTNLLLSIFKNFTFEQNSKANIFDGTTNQPSTHPESDVLLLDHFL